MRASGICRTLFVLVITVSTLTAQNYEERIRRLEEQNRALAEQNAKIMNRLTAAENQNAKLERELDAFGSGPVGSVLEQMVDELSRLDDSTNELSESALTRHNLVRSGFSLQFYGRLRTDVYYNSARMNRLIDPQWVLPEDGINAEPNDDAFALDSRLTTVGLNLDAGQIGDARVRGKVEFDFANFPNGLSESRAPVRLLFAYVDFEFGQFNVRVGQDWDLFSPLDPSVDGHRHLWDNGNLGDRRPQIQAVYRGGERNGLEYQVGLALGATGSVDNLDSDDGFGAFLSNERDGFDFGLPHVQFAASLSFATWVPGQKATFGLSGVYGGLESDFAHNNEDDYEVWALSIDFEFPLLDSLSLKGEAFIGQALADFRGGIGQSINTTLGDEIQTMGGWAELFWQASQFFGVGIGAAIDNPEIQDLEIANRASNWVVYVATRFDWGGGLITGFDAMFWRTQYVLREEGDTLRFDAFVELHF